jgi:hypothetical protein
MASQWDRGAILGPCLPLSLIVLALTPTAVLLSRRLEMLGVGALLLALLLPLGLERVSAQRSPSPLGQAVKARWQPGAALVGVHLYSQAMSFYSGQVFHLLSFRTELDFGRRLQPESGLFFRTLEEMAAFAASRPAVFFFLKAQDLSMLKEALPGKYQPLGLYKDCLLLAYEGK